MTRHSQRKGAIHGKAVNALLSMLRWTRACSVLGISWHRVIFKDKYLDIWNRVSEHPNILTSDISSLLPPPRHRKRPLKPHSITGMQYPPFVHKPSSHSTRKTLWAPTSLAQPQCRRTILLATLFAFAPHVVQYIYSRHSINGITYPESICFLSVICFSSACTTLAWPLTPRGILTRIHPNEWRQK